MKTQQEVFRRRTAQKNNAVRLGYFIQTPDAGIKAGVLFKSGREKPDVPDLADFQRHTIAVPYGRINLQLAKNTKENIMPGTTKYITLEDAKKAMAAAEAEARKNNWNVAIAILDAGASLIMFQKIDDTQLGSVNIAIGKAKSAVHFKRPTKALEDMIVGGRQVFLAVEGITPLQGGLPVIVDGQLIGAVGVSGVLSSQDEQVAQAAVNVLQG